MKRANFHAANTVLMFEGGGMRASYTAAMASLLLEQNITFGHVCGISAGCCDAWIPAEGTDRHSCDAWFCHNSKFLCHGKKYGT